MTGSVPSERRTGFVAALEAALRPVALGLALAGVMAASAAVASLARSRERGPATLIAHGGA